MLLQNLMCLVTAHGIYVPLSKTEIAQLFSHDISDHEWYPDGVLIIAFKWIRASAGQLWSICHCVDEVFAVLQSRKQVSEK